MLIQANMTEMRVNTEQTHKLYQNNETCLTTALSPNKAHVQTKIFLIYYRIFWCFIYKIRENCKGKGSYLRNSSSFCFYCLLLQTYSVRSFTVQKASFSPMRKQWNPKRNQQLAQGCPSLKRDRAQMWTEAS